MVKQKKKKDRGETSRAEAPRAEAWYAVVSSTVDNITKIKITKYVNLAEATEKRRVPAIVVQREQLNGVVKDLLPR